VSGRSVGFLAIVTIVASLGCSSSPTAPERAPAGEPGTLQAAAHLDCDSAEDIRDRIDDLEGDGMLNHGQATALRAKLAQAERPEAAGRPAHAAEAYARLIAQIEEWVADGVLTEEEAADLLACAEDVLDGPEITFVDVSAGAVHTCGITPEGAAYCWGDNSTGELGDGNAPTDRDTPVLVQGALVFASISAGSFHTCGVTTGGDAYCWGDNSPSGADTPVLIGGGLVFESISAGDGHNCGVTTSGEAYCWGGNGSGQLGGGNVGTGSDTPVLVLGGLVFESISAGGVHTCGLTTGGDAYCWGDNSAGELGDGNAPTDRDTPVLVDGAHAFGSISAGRFHTCGVTTGGDALCWGTNRSGELGDGNSPTDSDIPILVQSALMFESIGAGAFHSCGVVTSGGAYCWGSNSSGELGNGNGPADSDTPVLVAGAFVFESISTGADHTCGATTTGVAYCWGQNSAGELGDGNAPTESDTPVAVAQP
jgi:alpha-tubulin suppressor-like RCC1 family protein